MPFHVHSTNQLNPAKKHKRKRALQMNGAALFFKVIPFYLTPSVILLSFQRGICLYFIQWNQPQQGIFRNRSHPRLSVGLVLNCCTCQWSPFNLPTSVETSGYKRVRRISSHTLNSNGNSCKRSVRMDSINASPVAVSSGSPARLRT